MSFGVSDIRLFVGVGRGQSILVREIEHAEGIGAVVCQRFLRCRGRRRVGDWRGVLGVVHRVVGVLHRVLGVVHRVVGVLHRVLGVVRRVVGVP